MKFAYYIATACTFGGAIAGFWNHANRAIDNQKHLGSYAPKTVALVLNGDKEAPLYAGKIHWQNNATEDVTLLACQTSCGCVVTSPPLGKYPPGSVCAFPVTMKLGDDLGLVRKKVILELEQGGKKHRQLFTVCAFQLPPCGLLTPAMINIEHSLGAPQMGCMQVSGSRQLVESLSFESFAGLKIDRKQIMPLVVDGADIPDLWRGNIFFSVSGEISPLRLKYRFSGGEGEVGLNVVNSFSCVCSPSSLIVTGASGGAVSIDIMHKEGINVSLGELAGYFDFAPHPTASNDGILHTRVELRIIDPLKLSKAMKGELTISSAKNGTLLNKVPIYYVAL